MNEPSEVQKKKTPHQKSYFGNGYQNNVMLKDDQFLVCEGLDAPLLTALKSLGKES